MGSFGERLRREREMRKITLDEIAAATKIGTRNLKALEDEEFKKLPGGIFNKGFVRAYAKFLGIDEEQAVADFLAASGETEKTSDIDPVQLLAQHEDVKKKSKSSLKKAKELQSIQSDSPSGFPWVAILGLILLIALTYGARHGYFKYKAHKEAQEQAQRDADAAKAEADAAAARLAAQAAAAQAAQQPPAEGQPPASEQSIPPSRSANTPLQSEMPPTPIPPAPENNQIPKEKPSKPAPNSAQSATPAPGNFVVSIVARQTTWISITADGKRVMSGELSPSSQRSVQAHKLIVLKTGNAGGMDLALNGKPMAALGAENEVRTVTINAEGLVQ